MRNANVGCGPNLFVGANWHNLDKEDMRPYIEFLRHTADLDKMPEPQAALARRIQAGAVVNFRVHDFNRGLPFASGSVGLVYLGQVIEHLNPVYEAPKLLRECDRVLRSDGLLRIATPDLDLLLEAYRVGRMDNFAVEQPEPYAKTLSQARKLGYILYGSLGPKSTSQRYDGHQMLWSRESIRELLEETGFRDVRFLPPNESQYAAFAEECTDTGISHSFFCEARK